MARARKTHIRNPTQRNESICNRMSVQLVDVNSEATCKTCRLLAVDGTLERLEADYARSHQTRSQKGSNTTGRPRYTEMQKAFARHPNVTTDPGKAALDAGYSASYVKSHAHRLREQLSGLIMEYQAKAMRKSAISKARVQSELAAMGFANVLDYFHVNEETGAMRPKQLNELTREQAAAIQEIKVVEFDGKMVVGHIKLADKRANLVELGKTIGMFNKLTIEDKREDKILLNEVPTEALEDAEKRLLNAVAAAKGQRAKNDAVEGDFEVLPAPGAVEQEDPI